MVYKAKEGAEKKEDLPTDDAVVKGSGKYKKKDAKGEEFYKG